ncbi:MAG: hypothetical protein AcusKO_08240 [Acuticoccus sp.]
MATTPGTIVYEIPNTWDGGFVAEATWTPHESVSSWRIEFTFDGEITNVWNARIVSQTGNHYVIENETYNGSVAAGQPIDFGFQASGTPGSLTFLGADPIDPPDFTVLDASTIEGTPSGDDPAGSVMGPLSTSGNQIVDAAGNAVQIEAVNWFGMETSTHAPHGLWTRNWQEMMDEIKATGFNAIRLPFSLEAVLDASATPNGIDFGQNPDLAGLSSLEILDKIVAYAEDIELGIILDNHRSAAGDGPNGNGLWYDGGYSQADWVGAWTMLAERYGDSPAIIGADLANEPHSAEWNAWASAAETAGNAILAETDNWLVFVEGVGSYEGDSYWWGGSLKGVADRPVVLDQSDKLVYSPHDYPASVYDQPWFSDGSNLFDVFRENWGFIHEEGIAPIFLGEFGSRLETAVDQVWADAIVAYLGGDYDGNGTVDPGATEMNFAWWSWNPNSTDTGGILEDDWNTIRQDAVDLIAPLLDDAGGVQYETLRFAVSLDEASPAATEIDFATSDGTATAGEDYIAKEGTLIFAPGETLKYVDVTVLPDSDPEGTETVFLDLEGAEGTERAVGTIVDDDGGSGVTPTVSIADVAVDEDAGKAILTATLSAPASEEISIRFRTKALTATGDEDYVERKGIITFAAGETEATSKVRILDDDDVEGKEILKVKFKVIEGDANVDDDDARIVIHDDDDAVSLGLQSTSATSSGCQLEDEIGIVGKLTAGAATIGRRLVRPIVAPSMIIEIYIDNV